MRISVATVETATPEELRDLAARLQLEVIRLRATGKGGRVAARADQLERRAAELRVLAGDRLAAFDPAASTNEMSARVRGGPDPSALLTVTEAARLLRMRRGPAVRAIRESGAIIVIEGRERVRWGQLQRAMGSRVVSPPRPGRPRRKSAGQGTPTDPWERFLPKR